MSIAAPEPELDRALLSSPTVAWPTLALWAFVVSAWLGMFFLHAHGVLSSAAVLVPQALLAYWAFSVLHEAAHRSIVRVRWLNDLIGRASGLLLFTGLHGTFRWMHQQHHRFTNDPEHDPDMWSGRGSRLTLPLRWATQDLQFYGRFLRLWRSMPPPERLEFVIDLLLHASVVTLAIRAGFLHSVLWCWLVPSRLAIFCLAYTFDYLPHRPHAIPASQDRFRATHIIDWPPLVPLFLCQNLHLIHHLYPAVPFYRYPRIWRAQRQKLLARGALRMVPPWQRS